MKKQVSKKTLVFLMVLVCMLSSCPSAGPHYVPAAGKNIRESAENTENGGAGPEEGTDGGAAKRQVEKGADTQAEKGAGEESAGSNPGAGEESAGGNPGAGEESVGSKPGAGEEDAGGKDAGEIDFEVNDTEEAPLLLTYGTADVEKTFTLRHEGVELQEEILSSAVEVLDDGETLGVAVDQEEKTVIFTPRRVSGKAVSVRLSMETENYSFEKTVWVRVEPLPLAIDADSIAVSAPGADSYTNTKVYDAGDQVDVRATLRAPAGLAVTDSAAQEIKEHFTKVVFHHYASGKKDVRGEEEKQTFTFAPEDLSLCTGITDPQARDNFTVGAGEKAEDVWLVIKKRPLYLAVKDGERPYRSLAYARPLQELVYVTSPGDGAGFAGEDSAKMAGFSFPVVIDMTAQGLTEANVRARDTAVYGVHKGALALDVSTGNATGNYVFDVQKYSKGSLTISEEENAEGYVAVDCAVGRHVWETAGNAGPVRYYGREAWIPFVLSGGYNRIYLADGTDVTDTGITSADLAAGLSDGVSVLRFYLTREEPAASGGTAKTARARTKPFDISFRYDRDAPNCSKIAFGEENKVVSDLASAVTFGTYNRKQLVADVAFDDAGAGVGEWSYYVATTDRDGAYEELLEDAVFQEGTEDGRIPVGTLTEEQEEGNNYIVFVKVGDHVGNFRIYGSNGAVLENFHDISVSYGEKAAEETGRKNAWNNVSYYPGGAVLTLKAEEGGSKYYSGLESMAYVVSRRYGDGQTVTDREKTVVTKATEDHAAMPAFPRNVTLAGLREYCTITKTLNFANDPGRSQVVTVRAEARDHAGNAMARPSEHTLVLDPVSPTVTSSWAQANNRGAFSNGCYANSGVTYTVAVKERFLRTVGVSINGVSHTLAELEEKKDRLGIASVVKDTDMDISRTTDEAVWRFAVTFDADGEYTVQTTATDAAGNSGCDSPFHFVIDTVRPELELTYAVCHTDGSCTVQDPSRGHIYAGEDAACMTVAAVIKERNFDSRSAEITVKATDSRGRNVRVGDYAAAFRNGWADKGYVSGTDRRHVYELALPKICVDANYKFTYNYTDLAGNELKARPVHSFTLDRTGPTGAIKAEDLVNGSPTMVWKKLLPAVTFGRFGKNRVRVSMTGEDGISGIASIRYLASDVPLSRSSLERRTDWKTYKGVKTFRADRYLVVYGKIMDMAGNIRYISTDGMIIDQDAPEPEVTVTPEIPDRGRGVYRAGNRPGFRVAVTDPGVGGAYAGLRKITYKIVNGTNSYTETGTLAEMTRKAHRQKWTGHAAIDPERFYSNDVRVTVAAEDWSGNSAVSGEARVKIDNRAPVVKFSFDKSDVRGGKYYGNDKELTITVHERNFDPSCRPEVVSSAGGGCRIGGWTHHGELHTLVVAFNGDSDYSVSFSCYDLAGNKSNTERLQTFTIDKTAPAIRIAFDGPKPQNGNYFKEERTAVVTVTERNFDPARIRVDVSAPGGSVPEAGGWSGSGDTHVAEIRFSRDARYTLSVGGTDLAGNAAARTPPQTFTVDKMPPEIAIQGIQDRSANNGTVAPVIRIRDTNFAAGRTEITLAGAARGALDVKQMAAASSDGSGMTVTFRNFAGGMDDIYTLRCRSADRAGNESTAAIRFSVNRDGSAYEIDGATQELLDRGYTRRPQDIVVTEINVDELELTEISYSRDGRITVLKKEEDYTVEESGGEKQWKKYTYRIHGACFEAEGFYTVNLYSEDAAHNAATNGSRAKTLEFTVDRTAPVMVVADLADGARYKEESHSFTLNARDNSPLAWVEVYLDGRLAHTYRGDELAGGEIPMEVGSSNSYQTIALAACDQAGNISRKAYDPERHRQAEASYSVLVTADSFVQFVNNRPLLGAIALSAAAAAFLAAMAAGKWRKKGSSSAGGRTFLKRRRRKISP